MAAPPPQLPPLPGFRPDLVNMGGMQQPPYAPQQYPGGQQYPQQGQFPNQYPAGQQYPQQGQYPKPQQSPSGYPAASSANFPGYGPPPMGDVPLTSPAFKVETGGQDFTSFSNKAIRAVFIRKVYLILMVQLVFTLAVVSLFVFEKNVNMFVKRNRMYYYISYFIFLGVYIALACCGNIRRQYPTNMILLTIFTICMSYMLGTISSFYDTEVVLMTVGICAAICLVVTLFSFHTKFDFTTCGGVLFILVWVLFLFGILTIFTYNRIMSTIYAGCGALLFTAFLAYDTQMLMGGKKHEISPEEHIFAAMQIYLDIVYLFMMLLSLVGMGRD